jgi:hypothetical protein
VLSSTDIGRCTATAGLKEISWEEFFDKFEKERPEDGVSREDG